MACWGEIRALPCRGRRRGSQNTISEFAPEAGLLAPNAFPGQFPDDIKTITMPFIVKSVTPTRVLGLWHRPNQYIHEQIHLLANRTRSFHEVVLESGYTERPIAENWR